MDGRQAARSTRTTGKGLVAGRPGPRASVHRAAVRRSAGDRPTIADDTAGRRWLRLQGDSDERRWILIQRASAADLRRT